MSDRESELLSAIRDRPDQDRPRLDYARWLEEQGDERGELMRIQVELAGLDEGQRSGRRRAQALREREDALASRAATARWRRGPSAFWILVRADELTGRADVLQRSFVRDLMIDAPLHDAAFEALLDLLPLARLRGLAWNGPLPLDQLRALLAAASLRSLETLDLWRTRIGDEGVAAIAAAPTLSNLAALGLCRNDVGPEGAAALAGSGLRSLRTLELADNAVTGDGVAALVGSAALGALVHLDLARNPLVSADVVTITGAPGIDRFRSLGLAGCPLDRGAMCALALAPGLSRLDRLDVSSCRLDGEGIGHLVASPHLPRTLRLEIDPEAVGLRLDQAYDGPIAVADFWDGRPRGDLASRFTVVVVTTMSTNLPGGSTRIAERFLGHLLAPWW